MKIQLSSASAYQFFPLYFPYSKFNAINVSVESIVILSAIASTVIADIRTINFTVPVLIEDKVVVFIILTHRSFVGTLIKDMARLKV